MDDDETRSRHEPTEDLTATQRFGEKASAQPTKLPDSIGKYRILSKLGEGGMGVVYEAEQQNPKRRVAVKVVRGGQFVDEQRIKMFQREADTLALLKHPNIGGIHESGRTEDGQHFFAMELVQGQTLDVYMKTRPKILDAAEFRFRLALLRKIADAVHYAHQRGVIHRDLKPSNIVVTEDSVSDASRTISGIPLPEIKILDFGLARITEGDMAAATMVTEIGTIKGTLPYMSPEQARGNPEEIDVRTDVYSLGVILYEMLSGQRPYDVLRKSVAEAVRVICDEPPKSLGSTISGMRRLDPDVETIVGKALEKELDRRYASAAALAEDIDRYLTSQPILARPPSTMYQLGKFAKRNKVLVGGVVATFVVLIAGIVLSTVQRSEAVRQRDEAIRQKYVATVSATESSLELREIKRAKRQLAECPEELRGWEWNWLEKRLDESVATMDGQDEAILSVAYSPDGSRIVVSGRTQFIRVLDAVSGELLLTLENEPSSVGFAGFTDGGSRIVTAADNNTLQIWDATSGARLMTMDGRAPAAISPDGSRIVSNFRGNKPRLWSAAGELLNTLPEHEFMVFSIAFSPDGTRFASGDGDTLRLFDGQSGELLRALREHDQVNAISFHPDGKTVASGNHDGTITLRDAASGEALSTLSPAIVGLWSLSFNPDGTLIAAGYDERTVRVWDTTSGELLATLTGHTSVIPALTFSPDGAHLASGGGDGAVKLWDMARLAETSSGEAAAVLEGHEGTVFSIAFSPDGARIASSDFDGGVRLWDTATGELLASPTGHEDEGGSLALFQGDDLRIVSISGDHKMRLWDPAMVEPLATFEGHEAKVLDFAFSPDGKRAVSASVDKTVRLWDVASGQLLATLEGHREEVNDVAFSPDGSRIASCSGTNLDFESADKTIRLWDAETGELLSTLEGHEHDVFRVDFSPDGSRIASASNDETVRLWDTATGELLATMTDHDRRVWTVTFSPDGTRIASGSADRTVRLWDAVTGDLLLTLRGRNGQVWSVAFSPDGTRIASGHSNGTIRLW